MYKEHYGPVTVADIDAELERVASITPLPNGYRFFHRKSLSYREVGIIDTLTGIIHGHEGGDKRRVFYLLRSTNPVNQWAKNAWFNAIIKARESEQATITGGGFTIRLTPKFFHVTLPYSKRPHRRFDRDTTNPLDIVALIVG